MPQFLDAQERDHVAQFLVFQDLVGQQTDAALLQTVPWTAGSALATTVLLSFLKSSTRRIAHWAPASGGIQRR